MTKYTEKILRVREIISLDRVLMLVLFLALVISYQQSMGTESTVSFSPLYEGWQVHKDGSYIPLDKESYQDMKARNPITIKRALTKELEESKNLIFYTYVPLYSQGGLSLPQVRSGFSLYQLVLCLGPAPGLCGVFCRCGPLCQCGHHFSGRDSGSDLVYDDPLLPRNQG